MSKPLPDPDLKKEAIQAFKARIGEDIDAGINNHEQSMTRLGFLFLGLFVAVIVVAALLP